MKARAKRPRPRGDLVCVHSDGLGAPRWPGLAAGVARTHGRFTVREAHWCYRKGNRERARLRRIRTLPRLSLRA